MLSGSLIILFFRFLIRILLFPSFRSVSVPLPSLVFLSSSLWPSPKKQLCPIMFPLLLTFFCLSLPHSIWHNLIQSIYPIYYYASLISLRLTVFLKVSFSFLFLFSCFALPLFSPLLPIKFLLQSLPRTVCLAFNYTLWALCRNMHTCRFKLPPTCSDVEQTCAE